MYKNITKKKNKYEMVRSKVSFEKLNNITFNVNNEQRLTAPLPRCTSNHNIKKSLLGKYS